MRVAALQDVKLTTLLTTQTTKTTQTEEFRPSNDVVVLRRRVKVMTRAGSSKKVKNIFCFKELKKTIFAFY